MPINLGDIQYAVGVNTVGMDKAMQKMVDFSSQVDRVSKSQSAAAAGVAAAYQRQEQAITSALLKAQGLQGQISRSPGIDPAILNTVNTALNSYVATLTKANVSTLGFQRANERLNAAFGAVKQGIAAFNAQQDIANNSKLIFYMRELATVATLATGPLGGVATRISAMATIINRGNLEMAAMVIGFGAATFALEKMEKAALNAGKQVDSITEALTATTGSNVIAMQSFADLMDVANKSGYQVKDLAEQWINFSEVTQNTALAGQKGEQVFKDFAMILGTLHKSPQEAANAFRQMQTMMDNTVVTTMNLRRAFGNDLPGAMKIAAEAMNMSPANFLNALKKGLIETEDLLPKMAALYKKAFNIGDSVDTLEASQARLHNANLAFFNDIDKSLKVTEGAKSLYEGLAVAVDTMRKAMDAAGPVGRALVATITTIAGTYVAVGLLTAAFKSLATAVGLASLAANLSPWGRIAQGMAIAAGATVAAYEAYKTFKTTQDDVTGSVVTATKATNDYLDAVKLVGATHETAMAGAVLYKNQQQAVQDATKALQDFEKQQAIVDANRASAGLPTQAGGEELGKYRALKKQMDDAKKALQDLGAVMDQQGKHSAPFVNQDQLDKIALAKEKITDLNIAVNGSLAALASGGLPAYKKFQETISDNQKQLEFQKTLMLTGQTFDQASVGAADYVAKLHLLNDALDQAKINEKGTQEINQVAINGFQDLGKAIAQSAETGKFNMQSFSQIAITAIDALIQKLIELSTINPLINAVFPGSSGGNNLPTLSGSAGGGATGLAGLIGQAGGSWWSGTGGDGTYDTPPTDGAASGIGDFFSGLGFASGGNPPTGMASMVGEDGPELWIPSTPGTIIPNSQLGSGGDTHVHLNIQTGVSQTVRAEIQNMLPNITSSVKSSVMDAKLRGGKFASAFN